MEHESLGERIAYWRRRRGYSQQVLAGLVGRSASWMTKVERGDRIVDKVSVLLALADALKVEPSKLLGGSACITAVARRSRRAGPSRAAAGGSQSVRRTMSRRC